MDPLFHQILLERSHGSGAHSSHGSGAALADLAHTALAQRSQIWRTWLWRSAHAFSHTHI